MKLDFFSTLELPRVRHFTGLYGASAFCLLCGSIIHFTILLALAIGHSSRQSAFGFETRWQSSSGLGKTLWSPASGTAPATSAGHRNCNDRGGGCLMYVMFLVAQEENMVYLLTPQP